MLEIFNRFKEPSSWAGITGLIAVLLPNLNPGLVSSAVAVLAGIAGLLAVIMAEKK